MNSVASYKPELLSDEKHGAISPILATEHLFEQSCDRENCKTWTLPTNSNTSKLRFSTRASFENHSRIEVVGVASSRGGLGELEFVELSLTVHMPAEITGTGSRSRGLFSAFESTVIDGRKCLICGRRCLIAD